MHAQRLITDMAVLQERFLCLQWRLPGKNKLNKAPQNRKPAVFQGSGCTNARQARALKQ
jgi:hypothetical protein